MCERRLAAAAIPVLLCVLAIPSVHAGDRDHVDGFFMRLSVGGGAANTSIDNVINLDTDEVGTLAIRFSATMN